MDQASDEDLVDLSKAGNMDAFKQLVERHEGKVAGVVYSMVGQSPEAEDIGQEVFIRFYESLDKFRGNAAPSTYIIRIAINLSLNEIKKRKRKQLLFRDADTLDHVRSGSSNQDIMDVIQFELNKLDKEAQSVLTLRLIEGYSTKETADILDIPLGTVLSRLSRGQKKLRTALTKYL